MIYSNLDTQDFIFKMPKSSPGHFSGTVDAFYDADFTAQISSKMQVPDKISVIGGASRDKSAYISIPDDQKAFMHVPERIIVAGGNEHIAAREELPELRLESALTAEPSQNILAAPPRVLTLNQYAYPSIDTEKTSKDSTRNSSAMGNGMTDLAESAVQIFRAPEDKVALLTTQVKLLRNRVAIIEADNQMRQQREILVYSAGVIYFLFKGLMWLHRHL